MKVSKSIHIIIIGLSILLISWYPYQTKLDKKDDNLKGSVKTVIQYARNWGDKNIIVKEYNKQGKLTEIKFYGLSTFEDSLIAGSFPDSINSLLDTNKLWLLYINTYDYSTSGKLTRYKRFDVKKKKELYNTRLYYDDKDSLIASTEIHFNKNDSIVIDSTNIYYTTHNRSIVKTVINSSSETVLIKTYLLNKQGRIESSRTKDYNNPDCLEIETYVYDEQGRIRLKIKSNEKKYDFDYCESERQMITYNEHNNIIKSVFIREGRFDTVRREIIHEYDTLENRTKFLEFIYKNDMLSSFSQSLLNKNGDFVEWYSVEYYINKNNILHENPVKENYFYIYDSIGNWVNVKRYREGELDSEDERIIKYYN